MIRINLLGQPRPRARRRAVPVEGGLQLVFAVVALALALIALGVHWTVLNSDYNGVQKEISQLKDDRARLQPVKEQVEQLQQEEATLKRQIEVIEQLKRNRTGAQELLDALANTVTRVDALWMTSLTRKGSDLTMEGSADSIAAVANFITQLKRSGYFAKVEISESRQDERRTNVTTFVFKLTATFTLPPGQAAAAPAAKS